MCHIAQHEVQFLAQAEMLFSRLARRTRPNQPPSLSFEEPSEEMGFGLLCVAPVFSFSRTSKRA